MREQQIREIMSDNLSLSGSTFNLKEWLKNNDNKLQIIGRIPADIRWELAKDVDGNIWTE